MLDAIKFCRTRIDVSVSQPEYQVVFAVKDDGEGIPVANHDSIFRNTFKGRTFRSEDTASAWPVLRPCCKR